MKNFSLTVVLVVILTSFSFSQSKFYTSSAGEMIFSFATIDYDGDESGNVMRWSPVFNGQVMYNADVSRFFGMFTGLALRNVGFIYDNYKMMVDEQEVTVKKKFRTYNIGLPVGIKLGHLEKGFIYGGYEFELPVHYKEKTFRNEDKTQSSAWFSKKVEQFQHGFLVGIQFPFGSNIKFKYYLSNFHNKDYIDDLGNKPYEFMNVNVFYISFNYNLFKDTRTYIKPEETQQFL